jgi:hypothetical protein
LANILNNRRVPQKYSMIKKIWRNVEVPGLRNIGKSEDGANEI